MKQVVDILYDILAVLRDLRSAGRDARACGPGDPSAISDAENLIFERKLTQLEDKLRQLGQVLDRKQ